MSLKRKIITVAASTVCVAGAIALGIGATGAYFTAHESMPVSGTAGKLSMLVNGAPSNAAPLTFNNVVPGSAQTAQFTVTNTGTVAADVTIGEPISVSGVSGNPALAANNYAEVQNDLFVGVDGHLPYESIGQAAASNPNGVIDLGNINPGQTETFTVKVGLSPNAGNDWQGATASGDVTVTLTQAH